MRNSLLFSYPFSPHKVSTAGFWAVLCFCLPLLGCTTTQRKQSAVKLAPHAARANIPRSPNPVVRVLSKQGRRLRYNVYNNSGHTFRGLVVIFEGVDCDGVRPRRLWAKSLERPLEIGDMRPFIHYIPRFCHHVRVSAFDRVEFKRRYRKHKPFVRYNFIPDRRKVAYKIYNRSILPFRGITVLIRGKDCTGPRTNYVLKLSSRAWLRPGYLRSFVRTMPYPCRTFRVFAFDRIDFQRIKRRMIRLYQRRRRLQNRFKNPPSRLKKPPTYQEI